MKFFQPPEKVSRLTSIPPKSLRTRGFRLVLLDLDDVLMPREGKKIPDDILHWIQKGKEAGLKLHILSNSKFPRRVREVCEILGIPGWSWTMKPLPFAYRRVMKKFGVKRSETVMLGDQLFSDILGAKWAGIHSIYLSPMTPERRFDRKIMRWLERILMG